MRSRRCKARQRKRHQIPRASAIDALRSEIAAQTKAQTETIMALHVETREAIAALRVALDAMPAGAPPADMAADMAPVLDALTRIEAGLPTQ